MVRLKTNYDGYHFCRSNMVDVYNPFSLVNALSDKDIKNYWATSGATSLLLKFVDDMEIKLTDYDHSAILSTIIETSDATGGGAELFLYQSGYLTIKGYMNGLYLLGFPNHEVRQALYETVLPALAMRKRGDIQSAQAYLYMHIIDNRYTEPFKADKRKVIALAVELDDQGKGLVDWKQVGVTEQ